MNSINEWDPLKKVIVGIADDAQIPNLDISLRTVNYADVIDISQIKVGKYPQQVINEANEDLEIFCNFLKTCDVEVVRPHKTPVPYYNYCPRDTVIIYNDRAVATPMSLQCRDQEYLSYKHCLKNIIEMPNYLGDDIYNLDCVGNPDVLALKELYPKFDAANVIRANNDLMYLVSNSGNKLGSECLQEILGKDVKVHILKDVYSYMHIDSTIAFLKEGLMLCNPSRIKNKDMLPGPFKTWDVIWCPDPVDIGYYPGYCHASPWINMNLLSINPSLVVLEENQHPLRKELEKHNIECAMLPMRQQRTLGGGFHCVTLDLIRK